MVEKLAKKNSRMGNKKRDILLWVTQSVRGHKICSQYLCRKAINKWQIKMRTNRFNVDTPLNIFENDKAVVMNSEANAYRGIYF